MVVFPTGGVGGFPGPLWRGNSGRWSPARQPAAPSSGRPASPLVGAGDGTCVGSRWCVAELCQSVLVSALEPLCGASASGAEIFPTVVGMRPYGAHLTRVGTLALVCLCPVPDVGKELGPDRRAGMFPLCDLRHVLVQDVA